MFKPQYLMAVVALAAAAAPLLSVASAQDRTGFYADIGANYTSPSNQLTQTGFTTKDSKGGVAYTLGVGTGLNSQWRLGVQVDYFKVSGVFSSYFESNGISAEVTTYSAVGTFYPSMKNEFWLKLNLGYGTDKFSGEGQTASASGFTGGLGAGYDWLIGKGGFVVTPYLSYMDLFSTGDFGGALSGAGVKGKVSQFQVGVTLGYKH